MEGRSVGRIDAEPEERHGILYGLRTENPLSARNPERNPPFKKHSLEVDGAHMLPVEDCTRFAFPEERHDGFGDEQRLTVCVPELLHDRLDTMRIRSGHDILGISLFVLVNYSSGCFKYLRRGAVVPFKANLADPFKLFREVQDVIHHGPAEGIDRLVVVTYHNELCRRGYEGFQEPGLHDVRILIFVHQHHTVPPVAPGTGFFRRLHENARIGDQVGEIQSGGLLLHLLIKFEYLVPLHVVGIVSIFHVIQMEELLRLRVTRHTAVLLCVKDPRRRLTGQLSCSLALKVEGGLYEMGRIRIVGDYEISWDSDAVSETAEEHYAKGVEGPDRDSVGFVGDKGPEPVTHFSGCLVGEGHRTDLIGGYDPFGQCVCNLPRYGAGLARTCTGQDQEVVAEIKYRILLPVVISFKKPCP